jgi:hypothetical protein
MTQLGEVTEIAYKISNELQCGLSKETIAVILALMEKYPNQITAESMAYIVRELPKSVLKRKSRFVRS